MKSEQLRDIKPPVEIADYSFYFYWGLIIAGAAIALFLVYLLYQKWSKNRKEDKQKEYLEILNNIDWSSPKKAAYRATYYGRLLCEDDRRKELFAQMLPELEKYKYKKEIDRLNNENLRAFELFRRVCNESV